MPPSQDESTTDPTASAGVDDAEFGPSGYLPARAANRARKIVLRERMGLHWPVAAVVAGVLILAVMIPAVLLTTGGPEAPFEVVGPLEEVPADGDALVEVAGRSVLLVRGGGVLAALADPPEGARFCASSRRIESPDGDVWTLQGRRVGGDAASLAVLPSIAYEGEVWVDPTAEPAVADPAPGQVDPAC